MSFLANIDRDFLSISTFNLSINIDLHINKEHECASDVQTTRNNLSAIYKYVHREKRDGKILTSRIPLSSFLEESKFLYHTPAKLSVPLELRSFYTVENLMFSISTQLQLIPVDLSHLHEREV